MVILNPYHKTVGGKAVSEYVLAEIFKTIYLRDSIDIEAFSRYAILLQEFYPDRQQTDRNAIRIWLELSSNTLVVTIPGTTDLKDVSFDLNIYPKKASDNVTAMSGVIDRFERYNLNKILVNGIDILPNAYPEGARLTLGPARTNAQGVAYLNLVSLLYTTSIVLGDELGLGIKLGQRISKMPEAIVLLGHSLGGGCIQTVERMFHDRAWIDANVEAWTEGSFGTPHKIYIPQVCAISLGVYPSVINDTKKARHLPIIAKISSQVDAIATLGKAAPNIIARFSYNIGPKVRTFRIVNPTEAEVQSKRLFYYPDVTLNAIKKIVPGEGKDVFNVVFIPYKLGKTLVTSTAGSAGELANSDTRLSAAVDLGVIVGVGALAGSIGVKAAVATQAIIAQAKQSIGVYAHRFSNYVNIFSANKVMRDEIHLFINRNNARSYENGGIT